MNNSPYEEKKMGTGFPNELTKKNIDSVISKYKEKLKKIPLTIEAKNFLGLMNKLKRDKIGKGPYPDVTNFEAANRIMTDLVLLNGVKQLLDGEIKEIKFDEYIVEYGIGNNNPHDIIASKNGKKLKGEVFNVAVVKNKKEKTLKKLRANKNDGDILLIIFNEDAVSKNYKPKLRKDEYFLKVDIKNFFRKNLFKSFV